MTLGLTICSPILVPPPLAEKALRPSSAVRAFSEKARSPMRSETARGSSTTGYVPGLERLRVARANRFFDRTSVDRLEVDVGPIAPPGAGPAGAGAIRRSNRDGIVKIGRGVEGEKAGRVGERRGSGRALEEPGGGEAGRFARRPDCRSRDLRTLLGVQLGGRLEVALRLRVGLRAQQRHAFVVLRGQAGQLLRVLDRHTFSDSSSSLFVVTLPARLPKRAEMSAVTSSAPPAVVTRLTA